MPKGEDLLRGRRMETSLRSAVERVAGVLAMGRKSVSLLSGVKRSANFSGLSESRQEAREEASWNTEPRAGSRTGDFGMSGRELRSRMPT